MYLAPDVGETSYELFVRDVRLIVEKSQLSDHIVIMGDFNLPKISWLDFEDFGLSPTNLHANLIDGLIDCDFQQLNSTPNKYGVYLDLVFSNSSSDVAIRTSKAPLLKLDRHHEAYEISVDISVTRYEPCSVDVERYRFAVNQFLRI
jgi:Endonuclease-reverse transcriptase